MSMPDEEIAQCIIDDLRSYWKFKMGEKESAAAAEDEAWMRYYRACEMHAAGETRLLIAYAARIGWDYFDVVDKENYEEPKEKNQGV